MLGVCVLLCSCERCGFMSSQAVCKACVLLEGLNSGLPNLGVSRTRRGGAQRGSRQQQPIQLELEQQQPPQQPPQQQQQVPPGGVQQLNGVGVAADKQDMLAGGAVQQQQTQLVSSRTPS